MSVDTSILHDRNVSHAYDLDKTSEKEIRESKACPSFQHELRYADCFGADECGQVVLPAEHRAQLPHSIIAVAQVQGVPAYDRAARLQRGSAQLPTTSTGHPSKSS